MPTVTEDVTVFQRLVSEIYKQNWPPPDGACNASSEVPQNKTTNARRIWNENEQSKPSKEKIQRPFSATLISPRRGKGSRLMSANQSSSKIKDAKGLNAATFQNRRKGATKVPEYDSNRVLSEGAAARNKALAAEYLAMLSGRNYLKKHYREQYWVNEALSRGRPQTVAAPSIQRRYAKLYPDLGSVIGGKVPYVAGTTAKPTSPPRLEAWRLTSNTAAANSDDAAPSLSSRVRHASEEEKVVVPELGLTIQAKKSWSNIPSGKCYRVLSHPNDTLASLCLEGRSAPSRANNSRTSSVSSALSMPGISDLRYALSSAGESTPSGSSDAMSGSRTGSGDDDLTESFIFSPNNDGSISKSAHESEGEPSVVCGIPDSVFKGVDEPDEPDSENRDAEYDEILEDNAIEDGDFTTGLIEDGVGRLSFSDLEESDISENEADDYDEGTVDENEANRRLQQVSAVFETTKDVGFSATSDCQVAIIVDPASDGDFSSGRNVSDAERPDAAPSDPSAKRYEFAEFLPQPYRDCDLKSFANLSPGIDWRNFIQTDSRNSPDSVKRNNKKENLDRRKTERLNKERKAAKRKNVESIVDRLIMLEKLQAISVQYEQDRKRHIMHRAKARHAAKISSHNQSSTSSANTNAAVPQKETETRPQSARLIRRRSSTVSLNPSTSNLKPRRPLPSSDSKADLLVNKSSPDLDLVRLSCTKNHLQYIRRNSASPRKKQRQGLFLPRHYEYSWSERLPASKRPSLNTLIYTKPRNCQYCRESEKKIAHLHTVQVMLNSRPRSSCSTFTADKQRIHPRLTTSTSVAQASDKSGKASKENLTTDRLNSETSQPSSSSRGVVTFGRVSSAASGRGPQDKIFAARAAALSSVARDYAKAAGKLGKSPRRSSASSYGGTRPGRTSPAGVSRMRRDAKVLKPRIIECSNIRLR